MTFSGAGSGAGLRDWGVTVGLDGISLQPAELQIHPEGSKYS